MSKTSTKERILEAAIDLFSQKGYDGVGVDLIAETAGIKGPSLYRHFKGKEDILNSMIEKVEAYYQTNFGSGSNPGKIPESMQELVEISFEKINFTMHDEILQKTRRILAMEQFRNPTIAQLTSWHHVDGLQNMFSRIFKIMIDNNVMKSCDPELTALEFTAPVSLLIHIYDRQPEREAEVMTKIESHMACFAENYAYRPE
ncbi:MAG: TetR/AcrR family transcriptional regulator [Emergencia sp.]